MPPGKDMAVWRERISRGLSAQKKYAATEDWTTYEDYYLGKQGTNLYVNYIFSLCRSMIPMTYFRNPQVSVTARREEAEAAAPVVEAVDNWIIQEIGLKEQLKLLIYDNFLYGIGILKLGYDSEYGFDSDQLVGQIQTGAGVADFRNETASQRTKRFLKSLFGEKEPVAGDMNFIEYDDRVQSGMPWALRWHPADFILEPGATCVEDAQWCAFRVFRKVADVKDDAKYSNTDDLKPGWDEEYFDRASERRVAERMPSTEQVEGIESGQEPRRDEWVELWELHDKKDQTIQVGARNHDKFLKHDKDLLQIDGLPVIAVSFNRNPKTFWGIPDARQLQPLQDELNTVTYLQQEYLKHNSRRIFTKPALLTATEKAQYLSNVPVAVVEVSGLEEARPIGDQIFQAQGFMPPDLAQRADQLRSDMREIIGFGRNQMGEWNRGAQGGAGRGTATEAQIVQQGAAIRVDERRDILTDVQALCVRKINQMIFQWWSVPKVIKIAGEQGSQWVKYTGTQLKGEYDYKIESDDALPMTGERRRQEALALYQMLAKDPFINEVELRKWLIDKFQGANANRLVKPPQQQGQGPSPEEQAAQQAAQQEMQAAQQEMQLKQAAAQQDMQQKQQAAEQEMRHKEVAAQQELMLKQQEHDAKMKREEEAAKHKAEIAKVAKKESAPK